jgi:predicted ribosomally synthesized peptide with SipW-like signal peptide
MKKIGLISLALVMALGALGVTFAGWTDTVTVNGTVNTGDVVLEVVKYSGTYVWKTDDCYPNEILVESGWMDEIGDPSGNACIIDAFPNDGDVPPDLDPVATAKAEQGQTAKDVVMTFDNLFPLVPVSADFLLHYAGSIPVKVDLLTVAVTGEIDDTNSTIDIEYFEANADGSLVTSRPMELALLQLHYCDYIVVKITITLDQVQDNQNKSGTITGEIGVKQWNEVPDPV